MQYGKKAYHTALDSDSSDDQEGMNHLNYFLADSGSNQFQMPHLGNLKPTETMTLEERLDQLMTMLKPLGTSAENQKASQATFK